MAIPSPAGQRRSRGGTRSVRSGRRYRRPIAQALVFGLVTALALVLGAAIGARRSLPEHLYASLLGFSGGALVSALSFEIFAAADKRGGVWLAGAGLLGGAGALILLDAQLLNRVRGSAVGLALLAAATLDGIPESLALGVSLIDGTSIALLVAIVAANLPEAVGGASRMRENGNSARFILGVWSGAAVLIAASVLLGRLLLGGAPGGAIAILLGFAGGAVLAALAALASFVLPEAFEHGGPYVAFSTVAGFFLSFVLSEG